MTMSLTPISPLSDVQLLPGIFRSRSELNRRYLMSLSSRSLLQNHLMQAGLLSVRLFETQRNRSHDPGQRPEGSGGLHWGWESPTCQLRGHFLGHWLSAAARTVAATADAEVKAKADAIVSELARCQKANGGEWVASVPPEFLDMIARGQAIWAPHYTVHKTFMGLVDMHRYAGSVLALDILVEAAKWFHRWSGKFRREEMDDILDVETGGMLEIWADLYGITRDPTHRELMERYTRPRLFDALLRGDDVLTNRHANTTIPEIHGAARAYEVTGDERWRKIVEAYWKSAVTERGSYCTGSQTLGEIWTPPFKMAARLGDTNQEHCVVYNMIRLADWLYRWGGDAQYADYIERNIYNGILAQQHPHTGMIAYFLPLEPGGHKVWGSPTNDFWCCHGTLVQAHSSHTHQIYYSRGDELVIAQYIPSRLEWRREGKRSPVVVTLSSVPDAGPHLSQRPYAMEPAGWGRPEEWRFEIDVASETPLEFSLSLRLPTWLSGAATIRVDGRPEEGKPSAPYHNIRRTWHRNRVEIVFPKRLTTSPLPDEPNRVAFMDGPVVLAGLCAEESTLYGDPAHPEALLAPDNEKEWWNWLPGYRSVGQERAIRFQPLMDVVDEPYTVYFPIAKRPS